jgi:sortase A
MKILVRKTSLRLFAQWTQRVLFAGAILMLGYCGFVLADTWMFQHREMQNLTRMVRDQSQGASRLLPTSASTPHGSLVKSPSRVDFGEPIRGDVIGRIEIPRIGVSVVVVEGAAKSVFRRAVGHIPGTAVPGESGNIGIAGHRDTFFRPLRNIQHDDIVTLTTMRGEFRYRVLSTKVVSPKDVTVLNPDGNEILTLITCYPFYFVGSAPSRFIVRAERIVQ